MYLPIYDVKSLLVKGILNFNIHINNFFSVAALQLKSIFLIDNWQPTAVTGASTISTQSSTRTLNPFNAVEG
jgi:hypothetical protein